MREAIFFTILLLLLYTSRHQTILQRQGITTNFSTDIK